MALKSNCVLPSPLTMWVSEIALEVAVLSISMFAGTNPTKRMMLSTSVESTFSTCFNPNPHKSTSGLTVGSNAPSESL